ncbi:UNVERIFIED_ORG: hypothetical protein E4P37_03335 [Bacillus sp. AZ43]
MNAVPSGDVLLEGPVRQGWWLVDDEGAGPGRVVAGPFADRAEAAWTAGMLGAELPAGARPVYGTRRPDGGVYRRPSPEDWAWLAHLGEQLERLPEDWDAGFSDDDPLVTLVVEVTAALAEAGLPVADSSGAAREVGGACLSPEPGLDGVVVSWRQHDRMSVDQLHGAEADALVQLAMNAALAEVLRARGFVVDAFGGASGHVVRRVG